MTYEFTAKTGNGRIVRHTVAIDVAGVGSVEFDRPSLYHMGRKAWHVDFRFEAEGREYWGTLWNDGETDINTHGSKSNHGLWTSRFVRRLADNHKRTWREALAKVGAPIIRFAKQERMAFIDAGDADNGERVAMGLAPAKPEPVEPVEPATQSLFIVTGHSVDGAEYFSGFGWTGDKRAALVMNESDATAIAAREDAKQAQTRNPDNGVYQIKATPWQGPTLYTLAEYLECEAESERLDAMYGEA